MSWGSTPAERFRRRCYEKEIQKCQDDNTIKILTQLKDDLELALIKAKAQLEYIED